MLNQLKNLVRPFYRSVRKYQRKLKFESLVSKYRRHKLPLKIVVGSSGLYDKGWIPSEEHILDLLNENTWKRYFNEEELESLLAEHVWEHLTPEEGVIAAGICYKFLKPGGYMRVAVPDGFHNQQEYIDFVKPAGLGPGADDHKVLYNYKTFGGIFSQAGFKINLLEYFDEEGLFHFIDWNVTEGKIRRSIRFDERNHDGKPNYTSIIIDALKV